MEQRKKSFLLTISAVLLWSTAATAFKLTLNGMNTVQLLFYSSVVSCIILFLLSFKSYSNELKKIFSKKYILKNISLGFLNPFFYYLVVLKAYALLPAQEAMILNYIWPIIITLFSVLFLNSKFTTRIILGIILAFAGVIVIGTKGEIFTFKFENTLGLALAVFSPFIWSIYWILNLKDSRPELVKLFSGFIFGTILIFFYVLLFDEFKLNNYNYLFGAIYVGLFEMGITFFLWLKGLQLSLNKAKTATLVYLSPFLSIIFIALFLNEKILESSVIGLLLIIAGISIQHVVFENGKIKIKL